VTINIDSVTAITATFATFNFSARAADGTIDLQIAPRPSFSFCVAPIYNLASQPAQGVSGLNQRSTLYARARNRRASGAVEDWSAIFPFRTADGTAQTTTPTSIMVDKPIIFLPEKLVSWETAPTATAGYPPSNLAVDAPVALQMPGSGGLYAIYFQSAGSPVDTLAILNTNVPEAAVITIYACPTRAGLDSGTGRITLASAVAFRASANVPGRLGYHGLFQFTSTSLPWFAVVISGTLPVATLYVEHLILGRNRVVKNMSVDKSETPLPKTTIDRTRGGISDRVDGIAMRKVQFDITNMTEAMYETQLGDLIYHENEPVFILPNSKSGAFLHDRMLYGDLVASTVSNPYSPRFTRTIGVNSLI
jgi:hypothetical protein